MAGEKKIARNILKYTGIFILCGWMFFLGILVGRGTAPVSFDTENFQKKLAAMVSIKKKEKQLEKKPDFGFYEMLKKPLTIGNTKFHGAEEIIAAESGERNNIKIAGKSIEIKKSRKSMSMGRDGAKSRPAVSENAIVYTIQIAACRNLNDALNLIKFLKQKGYTAYRTVGRTGGRTWHRVRIGFFKDRKKAMNFQKKLESDKIKGIILQKDNAED